MFKFGRSKEGKKEETPKSVTYILEGIGDGPSCDYSGKVDQLSHTPTEDKEGKPTTMGPQNACTEALKALGLPSGISYAAELRRIFVPEEAKAEIESNSDLEKRFRKAFGIDENRKLDFKAYL